MYNPCIISSHYFAGNKSRTHKVNLNWDYMFRERSVKFDFGLHRTTFNRRSGINTIFRKYNFQHHIFDVFHNHVLYILHNKVLLLARCRVLNS